MRRAVSLLTHGGGIFQQLVDAGLQAFEADIGNAATGFQLIAEKVHLTAQLTQLERQLGTGILVLRPHRCGHPQ